MNRDESHIGLKERMLDLGTTIEQYLLGELTSEETAAVVRKRHWDYEDGISESGQSLEQRVFCYAFWALLLLDEPQQHRTSDAELRYLAECLVRPQLFNEERAKEL